MTWIVAGLAATVAAGPAGAGPAGRVLFVRGAERSGGFLEANDDAGRTEQLADITNRSTANGNHGWFELAEALRGAGYELEQIEESVEPGAAATGPTDGVAVDLAAVDLGQYDVVVFGSNNARYDAAAVDVFEAYVRAGGGALFISDANFGGNWGDAPTSDQAFLDRLGWTMNQDRGTYALRRDAGDFVAAGHPIFDGVAAFDGEGVSPVNLAGADVGERLAVAKNGTRDNDAPGGGTNRPVNADDASLAVAALGSGRVAVHFDRNTFFNANGAGTNINRFDNRQYALNLFAWLAGGGGIAGEAFFEFDARQAVAVTFDADVSDALDVADLQIARPGGGFVDAGDLTLEVSPDGRSAAWVYDTAAFGPLPDGSYTATLPADAVDGLAGDVVVDFYVLAGDANRDLAVTIADFAVVRANFGGPGGFTQGDFDYDGTVTIADFALLRGNFGATPGDGADDASGGDGP